MRQGKGWSDSQIAAALDAGLVTVARVRQQLVEEGFESVLTPKRSPASARPRIADGAAEAKLTALAYSRGRVRDLTGSLAIHPMPLPCSKTPAEPTRPRLASGLVVEIRR